MKKAINKKYILTIIIGVLAAMLVTLIVILAISYGGDDVDEPYIARQVKEVDIDPGYDLQVEKIGAYSGIYMEDGSDEKVTDVLMVHVKNRGNKPIQYAEITLKGEKGNALFKLSTLNPGETVLVLEAERKKYTDGYTEASAANVAYFTFEPSLHEDSLKIQPLDGGFNITNISDKDIDGEIMVYFKDKAGDMLYGGITYRGRIEGGIKAGEIRQVMTNNFTAENTKVCFITIEGK